MILYLDCASGISGDMLVAALLDLVDGVTAVDALDEVVRPALVAVGVDARLVASERVRRGGVAGRAFSVAEAPGYDTFTALVAAVSAASLSSSVTEAAVAVARRLAAAEAEVHGGDVEHLHELSGIDTVVDLVSAAALFDRLPLERVVASPPALGSGLVQTAHGMVPVPAPAVCALLTGVLTAGGQGAPADKPLGELTTPTGAALLRHYVGAFGALPAGRLVRVAYGAGQREVPGRPNVLRALLIEPTDPITSAAAGSAADLAAGQEAHGNHVLLETTIDDMPAELLAHAADVLRDAGARDVWLSPALMKKGRPGVVLHVLAPAEERERLAGIVFTETSSFGLRVLPLTRLYADERRVTVPVEGKDVRVRLGYVGGRLVTASPEYEDVRRVACATGRTASAVYEAAQAQARAAYDG